MLKTGGIDFPKCSEKKVVLGEAFAKRVNDKISLGNVASDFLPWAKTRLVLWLVLWSVLVSVTCSFENYVFCSCGVECSLNVN